MKNTGAKIEMSSARDRSLTFLITGKSDSVLMVSTVPNIILYDPELGTIAGAGPC